MVCETAKALMENDREYAASMRSQRFVEITNSFYVDADFKPAFEQLGLDSLQAVFRFQGDEILTKENLGSYRSRLRFQTKLPKATLYLKRYEKPPLLLQTKNFLAHRTVASCAMLERETSRKLSGAGISTPRVIAYGQQMRHLSERRSFIITEQLADAESLEKKLPDYFHAGASAGNIKLRRRFITELAEFVKRFHETGFRHRDLYLCHIFHGKDGHFHLIDLARAFKPALLSQRYRAKDIAQLYYSAPAKYFSASDRLRFFLKYAKHRRLEQSDKEFVLKVLRKANRMAHHDKKQGRAAPFLELT